MEAKFSFSKDQNIFENIISCGMLGVSLDGERILFASEGIKTLSGFTQEEIKKMRKNGWFQRLVHPEDREIVEKESALQFQKYGRAKLSYRVIKKNGETLWVKQYTGIAKDPNGNPYCLCLIFDDSERSAAEQDAEKARSELETLINTIPGGVAKLCVDDKFRVVLASDGYYKMTGYTPEECRSEPIQNKGINFVLEEDIPVVERELEKLIRTGEPISVDYRIQRRDGSIAWNTAYCSHLEETPQGRVVDAIFLDTTFAKRNERQLFSLINSIPGGVVRFHFNGDIYIDYANEEFYRMHGCANRGAEEAPLKYSLFLHSEDKAQVLEKVQNFLDSNIHCPSLEYRIVTKNGVVRWMRASASRMNSGLEAYPAAQCIIMDITDEKQMARKAAVSEERYRIIAEQSQDIVYDWDIASNILHHSPVFETKFGYSLPENCPVQYLLDNRIVYIEDAKLIQQVFKDLAGGIPRREVEYRIRKADGSYIWCRNRMTTIFDDAYQPVQVVGIISDIDEYKKETASLRAQAKQDSLTGLLNRMAMQEQVQGHLNQSFKQVQAFFLIDIDNFKWINDTLGHMAGDTVLKDVAKRLQNNVAGEHLSGRMGGDEFAVFLTDAGSAAQALEKASALANELRLSFQFEDTRHTISVSIGVAVAPAHGQRFQELYEHSDQALYHSKASGRDRASLFQK